MSDRDPELNQGLDEQLDRACDDLEAAWQADEIGVISDLGRFIPEGENGLRRAFLVPLIAVDLEYRWKSKHGPLLDAYAAVFPELHADDGMPLELVREEWRVRQTAGETPSIEEYQSRFPHLTEQLSGTDHLAAVSETAAGIDSSPDTATVITQLEQGSNGTPVPTEENGATSLPSGVASLRHFDAPSSWTELLSQLRQLDLIPDDQLTGLGSSIESLSDTGLSAAELVDSAVEKLLADQHLTPFQTEVLLGRRQAPILLGEYVVTDELGRGGMGCVYRAVHRRMKRVVALKVLTDDLLDNDDALKRFRREVETVSRLDHPNIVAAHDADEVDGVHYYVMEVVNGDDLADHVKKHGPMHVQQALECLLQAARGLEYAHGEGIIHRDIKPHNLLLDADGTVKVLDLGLARLEQPDGESLSDNLTASGSMMGTVDYMAPEQALDSRRADARSDIYSLGCTLFFLITGRPLFGGDTFMKKLLAHRTEPAPSLREASHAASSELESAYQAMVAKEPDKRMQTMADVISSLDSCLETLPDVVESSTTVGEHSSDPFAATHIGESPVHPALAATVAGPAALKSDAASASARRSRRSVRLRKTIKWLCLLSIVCGIGWSAYVGVSKLRESQATIVLDLQDSDLTGATITLDGELVTTIGEADNTPLLNVPADSVEHTLEIMRDGSKPFSQTVRFDTAETRILPIELVDADALPANYALHFDGATSYAEFPDLKWGELDPLTVELTLAADTPDDGNWKDLLSGWHTGSKNDSHGFALSVTQLGHIRVGVGATAPVEARNGRSNWANIYSLRQVPPAQPVHLACVFHDGVQSLFVDGELQGSQNVGEFRTSDRSMTLGTSQLADGSHRHWFNGWVDEIRVTRGARYSNTFLPPARLKADDQTIALYHFDEGSGDVIQDASGNGHNGKIIGAEWLKVADVGTDGELTTVIRKRRTERAEIPDWARQPQYNHAIQLDGDADFLEIPTLLLGDMRPFTFEAWINPDDASQVGTVFSTTCTIRKPPQGLKLALADGNVAGLVHGSDTQGNAFVSEIQSGARGESLANQTDAHVAFCFDGESQHLYLNGQLIDSRRVVGARPSMTPLLIGCDSDGATGRSRTFAYFAGRLDEIRISHGQRYAESFEPERRLESDTDTLALYHCDEGAGDFAYDHSGNGHHARLVNARWTRRADNDSPLTGPLIARAPFDAEQARSLQEAWAEFLNLPVEFENGAGMKFRLIPPGEFYMGSSEDERLAATDGEPYMRARFGNEFSRHRVGIASPFYLGQYEITQAQYEEIAGTNPSEFSKSGNRAKRVEGLETRDHPVETVSTDEARQFCSRLSTLEGFQAKAQTVGEDAVVSRNGYRLPTEDEWEYACRAGTIGLFNFGNDFEQLDEYAWQNRNSGARTHPVGQLLPNGFGLFDMHGNVWEHCLSTLNAETIGSGLRVAARDVDEKPKIVARGAAWSTLWASSRCAVRNTTGKAYFFGFRVVLPIESKITPAIRAVAATRKALSLAQRRNFRRALAIMEVLKDGQAPSVFQRRRLSRLYALVANSAVSSELPEEWNAAELAKQAITHLEWLADRGLVRSSDIAQSDYEFLEFSPRFQLFKRRLSRTENWGSLKRKDFEEHHWKLLYDEFLKGTTAAGDMSAVGWGTYMLAALVVLNDGDVDAAIQSTGSGAFEFALMSSLPNADRAEFIRDHHRQVNEGARVAVISKLACLLYQDGDYQGALDVADRALKKDWNAHILNHLIKAMAMYRLDQKIEAVEYFEQHVLVHDVGKILPWDAMHVVETALCAVFRCEAEDLLFGHSETRDSEETMSLARTGNSDEALNRLKSMEDRFDELSARLKYRMARSYAQCWHHMRNAADVENDELRRVHDRAIELLEELRMADLLDPESAHLAIDFRPLTDSAEFLALCRKLDPEFDRTLTKDETLGQIAQSLNGIDEAPTPADRMEIVKQLETLGDRGFLSASDLENPQYQALESETRFLLLRERLKHYRFDVRRQELRERHWKQLYEEYAAADQEKKIFDFLVVPGGIRTPFAALALLNNDQAGFEKRCSEAREVTGWMLDHAVLASNPFSDVDALIGIREAVIARGGRPWDHWRLSYLKYSQQKWNDAIASAQASRDSNPNWHGHVLNDVVTAMSMHQSGQTDEARRFLEGRLRKFDSKPVSAMEGMHHTEFLSLAVWRRNAEELIIGHSHSREMDEIMSLARSGKPVEALERLKPFEDRFDTLAPKYRYYMARSYAQCWHHTKSDADTTSEEKNRLRDRAIEILSQMYNAESLDSRNAHLAIDLRPLASEAGFISLCRRMSTNLERDLAVAEVLHETEAGQLAIAAKSAGRLLNEDDSLSLQQRKQLIDILASRSTELDDSSTTSGGLSVGECRQQVFEQLLELADYGFLAEWDLPEWSVRTPWLLDDNGDQIEELKDRITAVHSRQLQLVKNVLALRGTVGIQIYDGLTGYEQWASGKYTNITSHIDIPDQPFAVWRIDISNQPRLDDERLQQLIDDSGPVLSLRNLRFQKVGLTKSGVSAIRELSHSVAHLACMDNDWFDGEALSQLSGYASLEGLYVNGTSLTESDVEQLKTMKTLKRLRITDGVFSANAIDSLQQALPDCEILISRPN